MENQTAKNDRQETLLSAWVIMLGVCAMVLLILESKGIIKKTVGDFGCLLLLSIIALSGGVFSIVTKRAPYRGGMADKENNPFSYYFMTTIWWFVSLLLVLAAKRALQ